MANEFRDELKKLGNKQRFTFEGTFQKTGIKVASTKSGKHYKPTLLLKDVKYDNKRVTEHLWFNYTKGFGTLGELKQGDIVQFDGRVDSYVKGYFTETRKRDYKIERPTKIKLVNSDVIPNSLPDPLQETTELIGYIMKANEKFYKDNDRPYDEWYVQQYENWREKHDKRK